MNDSPYILIRVSFYLWLPANKQNNGKLPVSKIYILCMTFILLDVLECISTLKTRCKWSICEDSWIFPVRYIYVFPLDNVHTSAGEKPEAWFLGRAGSKGLQLFFFGVRCLSGFINVSWGNQNKFICTLMNICTVLYMLLYPFIGYWTAPYKLYTTILEEH